MMNPVASLFLFFSILSLAEAKLGNTILGSISKMEAEASSSMATLPANYMEAYRNDADSKHHYGILYPLTPVLPVELTDKYVNMCVNRYGMYT